MAVKEFSIRQTTYDKEVNNTEVITVNNLEWAEVGIFTLYVSMLSENSAETVEVRHDSPFLDFDESDPDSGGKPTITLRLFNTGTGEHERGLFGESEQEITSEITVSAATPKYLDQSFVGFDQENLTAEDLELEFLKRDLSDLYIRNRDARVRASTDHDLSNVDLDLSDFGNRESVDVAPSRRSVAAAVSTSIPDLADIDARVSEDIDERIDNTPITLVDTTADPIIFNTESESNASSRHALVDAIARATVPVTINVNRPQDGGGSPAFPDFKVALTELHSVTITVDDSTPSTAAGALQDTGFVIPEIPDRSVIVMNVGDSEVETDEAHSEGSNIMVSVVMLRSLGALAIGDTATTLLNRENALVIRGIIGGDRHVLIARDADYKLLITTSNDSVDIDPLTISGIDVTGESRVSIGGFVGDINTIRDAGLPLVDSAHTDGTTDRIIWARNTGVPIPADGSLDEESSTTISVEYNSSGTGTGSAYFIAIIGGVRYLFKPTTSNIVQAYTFNPSDPSSDETEITGLAFDTVSIGSYNFGDYIFPDLENNRVYSVPRSETGSADGSAVFTLDPTTLTFTSNLITTTPTRNIKFMKDGKALRKTGSFDSVLNISAFDDNLVFTASFINITFGTTIDIPEGKSLASGLVGSFKILGDKLIYLRSDSGSADTFTAVYSWAAINAATASQTIQPIGTIDLGGRADLSGVSPICMTDEEDQIVYVIENGLISTLNLSTGTDNLELSAFNYGTTTGVASEFRGFSVESLALLVGDQVQVSLEGRSNSQVSNQPLDLTILDGDVINLAPSRRATANAIIDVKEDIDNISLDSVIEVDSASLPIIGDGDDEVAPTANSVAIYRGEVFVKEKVQTGEHSETHVDWPVYVDASTPFVFRGVFPYNNGISGNTLSEGDYWYDSGDHTWWIYRAPVDDDGNDVVDGNGNTIKRSLRWLLGPQGTNTGNIPNVQLDNHDEAEVVTSGIESFPGAWDPDHEVHNRQEASNHVNGDLQLFTWGNVMYVSDEYEISEVIDFSYLWKKLTHLDSSDINSLITQVENEISEIETVNSEQAVDIRALGIHLGDFQDQRALINLTNVDFEEALGDAGTADERRTRFKREAGISVVDEYDGQTPYAIGDIVYTTSVGFRRQYWIALVHNTNQLPSVDSVRWDRISLPAVKYYAEDDSISHQFRRGEVVVIGRSTFLCITDIETSPDNVLDDSFTSTPSFLGLAGEEIILGTLPDRVDHLEQALGVTQGTTIRQTNHYEYTGGHNHSVVGISENFLIDRTGHLYPRETTNPADIASTRLTGFNNNPDTDDNLFEYVGLEEFEYGGNSFLATAVVENFNTQQVKVKVGRLNDDGTALSTEVGAVNESAFIALYSTGAPFSTSGYKLVSGITVSDSTLTTAQKSIYIVYSNFEHTAPGWYMREIDIQIPASGDPVFNASLSQKRIDIDHETYRVDGITKVSLDDETQEGFVLITNEMTDRGHKLATFPMSLADRNSPTVDVNESRAYRFNPSSPTPSSSKIIYGFYAEGIANELTTVDFVIPTLSNGQLINGALHEFKATDSLLKRVEDIEDRVDVLAEEGGGSESFLGLTDTPAALGTAGQIVIVNAAEDALEFTDAGMGGGGLSTVAVNAPLTGDGTINNAIAISLGGIDTDQLANLSVHESKIETGAVTGTKIGADAIGAGKIRDNAIRAEHIQAESITSTKIDDDAVITSKIENGAVNSFKLGTSAVSNVKIATGAVDSVKLANGAVTPIKIADDAVTLPKLSATGAANQVLAINAVGDALAFVDQSAGGGSGTVLSDGVTLEGDGSIGSELQIKDIGVDTAQIKNGAITQDKIGFEQVSLGKISTFNSANGQVIKVINGSLEWSDDAGAGAGISSVTSDATLTGDGTALVPLGIAVGGVTSAHIAANAMRTSNIGDEQVTGAKIAPATIESVNLGTDSVIGAKIEAGSVSASKLGAGAVILSKIGVTAPGTARPSISN